MVFCASSRRIFRAGAAEPLRRQGVRHGVRMLRAGTAGLLRACLPFLFLWTETVCSCCNPAVTAGALRCHDQPAAPSARRLLAFVCVQCALPEPGRAGVSGCGGCAILQRLTRAASGPAGCAARETVQKKHAGQGERGRCAAGLPRARHTGTVGPLQRRFPKEKRWVWALRRRRKWALPR